MGSIFIDFSFKKQNSYRKNVPSIFEILKLNSFENIE